MTRFTLAALGALTLGALAPSLAHADTTEWYRSPDGNVRCSLVYAGQRAAPKFPSAACWSRADGGRGFLLYTFGKPVADRVTFAQLPAASGRVLRPGQHVELGVLDLRGLPHNVIEGHNLHRGANGFRYASDGFRIGRHLRFAW